MTKDTYDAQSATFARSRKNMRWPEIEYFLGCIHPDDTIVDIGCGSGRLIDEYKNFFQKFPSSYLGIDSSHGLLSEAKKIFPNMDFLAADMRELRVLGNKKFDAIFLIASFHHLETFSERQGVLEKLRDHLTDQGAIYMSNWNLLSRENLNKYRNSEIQGSENSFGAKDFNIKLGDYNRFYHGFTLAELDTLAKGANLNIIENRLFAEERNIITILKAGKNRMTNIS